MAKKKKTTDDRKLLVVKFVDGFLDGQKWKLRMPGEPVLPFVECKGIYRLHDRGEDKRVFRYEYRYEETWSEALGRLSEAERFSRLRKGLLHDPGAVLGLGASVYR